MNNMDLSNGGYVVLPVAEYNELIAKLTKVDTAVKVKRWRYGQHDKLEVSIDHVWLHEVATCKAAQLSYFEEYDLLEAEELYVSSVTLANHKEQSTIEE